MQSKSALQKLIQERAVVRPSQPITLASGKTASIYIDGKQVTLYGPALVLFAEQILKAIETQQVTAVGGPTMGADSIAAAVAVCAEKQKKIALKIVLVRKAQKAHGLQKQVEGPALTKEDRVLVVEDVITTGGSVLEAIEAIEKTGAKVVRVISLVDRGAGGKEKLGKHNYTPLFEWSEIVES